MTTETFWTNFVDLMRWNNELQKDFIQEMNNEQDQNKRFERLSALVHNLHKDGILSENRMFLQKLADDILLLHVLDQLKYIVNDLSLRKNPGIQKIQETHIRILQLYDISHLEQFKEKYQDINASIKSILQPVYKFFKEWHGLRGDINLDELSGFQSFIKSSTIPDLILILSIHLYTTDPSEQNPEILQEIANLSFHYFPWFNAFKNVPILHFSLLRGMVASFFHWILFSGDLHGVVTLNEIIKDKYVKAYTLHKRDSVYPAEIVANLNRILKDQQEKSVGIVEDFFNLIDTIYTIETFVEKLGQFSKPFRSPPYPSHLSSYYVETNEYIQFLAEQLLEHVPSKFCWNSFVDHALMFNLVEEKFHVKLSMLSEECLELLIQHAFENIEGSTNDELLRNTSTFLLLDPVLSKWKDTFRKELLKKRLKEVLSEKLTGIKFSREQFPFYPLLASLDQWMDENESIGLPLSPIRKLIIDSIDFYLSPIYELNQKRYISSEMLLIIIKYADKIFSNRDIKMFIDDFLDMILDIIPNVVSDRFEKIMQEFLENKAIQKAISKGFIEKLARETVRQKFASYMMVKFLRDVLYAFVHRGKRKNKWEDTVGLRESIEKYINTKKVDEDTKKILMEIKDMIR